MESEICGACIAFAFSKFNQSGKGMQVLLIHSLVCLLCIVELNNWPYSSELIAALSSAALSSAAVDGIDLIRTTIFLCRW